MENLLDHLTDTWPFLLKDLSLPKWRYDQISDWVFQKEISEWDLMKNLSKGLQEALSSQVSLTLPKVLNVLESKDGTKKILFQLKDEQMIESVIIPRGDRATLCISSQVGCGIGCKFCRTAEMGLIRNLTMGEIVGQVIMANKILKENPIKDGSTSNLEDQPLLNRVNHIVFMGMGEPLANLDQVINSIRTLTSSDGLGMSPRRITVSTSGLPSKIIELGQSGIPVNLAVSLTAADDPTREKLMPINRHYPIRAILDAIRQLPLKKRQRVTFEYVLLSGVNDRPEDAKKLARLLAPFKSKVNLIPFNTYEGSPFLSPSKDDVLLFQKILLEKMVATTIRQSRGDDILGACGQLAWEKKTAIKETSWNPVVFST
jgi:23S rRNA (adenine2503-C2)-methyltransferase